MKFLLKLSIYKTFLSVKLAATWYAFIQCVWFGRSWKEAYEEYMGHLAVNIARMHEGFTEE